MSSSNTSTNRLPRQPQERGRTADEVLAANVLASGFQNPMMGLYGACVEGGGERIWVEGGRGAGGSAEAGRRRAEETTLGLGIPPMPTTWVGLDEGYGPWGRGATTEMRRSEEGGRGEGSRGGRGGWGSQ